MRFKSGTEITPNREKFKIVFGGPISEDHMPKFGKVYTVHLYPFGDSPCHPKRKYMLLAELPFALFCEDSFEPVISTDELEQDLLEAFVLDKKLSDG